MDLSAYSIAEIIELYSQTIKELKKEAYLELKMLLENWVNI